MGYYGQPRDEARIDEVLTALNLTTRRTSLTRALSGGMKRRLLIAKALVHQPAAGLPRRAHRRRRRGAAPRPVDLRAQAGAEGTTIVLTTHYLEEAEELADRVGVINEGRLLLVEDKAAVMRALASAASSSPSSSPGRAARGRAPLRRHASSDGRPRAHLRRARGHAALGRAAARPLRPGPADRRRGDAAPRLEDVFIEILRGRPSRPPERRDAMNTLGMKTLLAKEVRRFMRVPGQTVLSPLISTTLYFLVFGYRSRRPRARGARACRTCASSSPAWCSWASPTTRSSTRSSSLFITKIQGTIVDLLVAPLGPRRADGRLHRRRHGARAGGRRAHLGRGRALHRLRPRAPAGDRSSSCCSSSLRVRAARAARRHVGREVRADQLLPHLRHAAAHVPGRRLLLGARAARALEPISLFNPMVYMVEGLRYGMLGQQRAVRRCWAAASSLALALVATGLAYRRCAPATS